MKVRIKAPEGMVPEYETKWAVWFDLRAIKDYTINPGEMVTVDTGVAIEIPEGYYLQIQSRSSTFRKHGLILVNGVWIIDNDYCGDSDTQMFQYMNFGKEPQLIERWTRIGQGVFVKCMKAEFEVVDSLGNEARGGFWTTGVK